MLISVLIPTIPGREATLDRVAATYREQFPSGLEVLMVTGHTWGGGLNELAKQARGKYWLCACDDKLPHAGWFHSARAMLDAGDAPQSHNFTVDGAPLNAEYDCAEHGTATNWTRDFLLTPTIYAKVGPFLDTTWYTDFDYSARLIRAGYTLRSCDRFAFMHLDGPRDWQTLQVDAHERRLWEEARG